MMMKKQLLIGVLLIMAMLSACDDVGKLPGGVLKYSYVIKKDHAVFEDGTYSFADIKDGYLGGGRGGYIDFPPLELNVTLKNGKQYHEVIELEPLIQAMEEKHELPDISKSEFGGFTELRITVGRKLVIDYHVITYTDAKIGSSRATFPVYHKVFN